MTHIINFNKLRKSKFNNKSQVYTSTLYGSRRFDSIKEARYCEELDWRLKAGEIKSYELQKRISLDVNNCHICNYYCDFRVVLKSGQAQYHEVKGFETEVYRLKAKLFEALIDEIDPGAEFIVIK